MLQLVHLLAFPWIVATAQAAPSFLVNTPASLPAGTYNVSDDFIPYTSLHTITVLGIGDALEQAAAPWLAKGYECRRASTADREACRKFLKNREVPAPIQKTMRQSVVALGDVTINAATAPPILDATQSGDRVQVWDLAQSLDFDGRHFDHLTLQVSLNAQGLPTLHKLKTAAEGPEWVWDVESDTLSTFVTTVERLSQLERYDDAGLVPHQRAASACNAP